MYNEFLDDLKQKDDMEKYAVAIYDSTKWRTKSSYNKPFVEYYHRYPVYRDYPVVNISYEETVLFCQWLTEKYNATENRAFKKVLFRLPTAEEWKNAARGSKDTAMIYPWGGPYLTNVHGYYMCNFKRIGDEYITLDTLTGKYTVFADHAYLGVAGNLNDRASYTVPVEYFHSNDYGIYNISGNVAEMTAEKGIARGGSYLSPGYDVRIDSEEKYTEPAAHIGFRFCMKIIEY